MTLQADDVLRAPSATETVHVEITRRTRIKNLGSVDPGMVVEVSKADARLLLGQRQAVPAPEGVQTRVEGSENAGDGESRGRTRKK